MTGDGPVELAVSDIVADNRVMNYRPSRRLLGRVNKPYVFIVATLMFAPV